MKYKALILFLILITGHLILFSGEKFNHTQDTLKSKFTPKFVPVEIIPERGIIRSEGFVPDSVTAIKIAEAIWLPIYGKGIYECKPYRIELKEGIWYISGTLPKNMQGGVPYIQISKENAMILKVYHTK